MTTELNSTAETLIALYAAVDGATLFISIVLIASRYMENDRDFFTAVEKFKQYVYSCVNEHITLYYIALFLMFMAYIIFAGLGLLLIATAFIVAGFYIISVSFLKACREFIKPPATANNNVALANDINPV